jgi:hypothetical protein
MILCKKILLIKSGGGTGPCETRQPDIFKVPNPADFRKMRLRLILTSSSEEVFFDMLGSLDNFEI